jgi:hypothetical protein
MVVRPDRGLRFPLARPRAAALTGVKDMRLDPTTMFVAVLVIGILAGIIFDRFLGPGWLKRKISGAAPGLVTSSLVGIAGAFLGSEIAQIFLKLSGYAVLAAAAVAAFVVLFGWRMAK